MSPREKVVTAMENGIKKIEEVFTPLIASIELKIGILQKAGQDPSNYFDLDDNEFVNYLEIRDAYIAEKEKTVKEFSAKMDDELKKFDEADTPEKEGGEIPWAEVAFYLLESAMENGIKIKIGDIEWDSTRPLGGEGSVFEEMRSAAMRSMGIDPDSDLGKALKDPINAIGDLAENLGAEGEKAMENIRIATDKAFTDAKRESDKALTNAKNATDKALTDVKREADKALTDARKTVEKAVRDVARELGRLLPKPPSIKPIRIKW
ncbi:hypothetical protein [Alteromonas macleodii]|uniref:Uncharacterized protein n=1 Tax=Alteromonas macleodii TaxID=28108 RepID=A0A6T9Y693_ALTMA|nr:hypothetical protein [Alteromonas macleodii]CAB9495816.1 protein of unknown function [Alteromonas macleodii]